MPSDLQVQEIVPSDGVLSDGVLALSMVIALDMTVGDTAANDLGGYAVRHHMLGYAVGTKVLAAMAQDSREMWFHACVFGSREKSERC